MLIGVSNFMHLNQKVDNRDCSFQTYHSSRQHPVLYNNALCNSLMVVTATYLPIYKLSCVQPSQLLLSRIVALAFKIALVPVGCRWMREVRR